MAMNEHAAVLLWLEGTPVLDKPQDSKQTEAVRELAGNEGFRIFLGLLLGSREAFYVQLARLPLNSADAAARASVIQGKIAGIDLARQTVPRLVFTRR